MLNKRMMVMSGATLVSALAIGFVMQEGSAARAPQETAAAEADLILQEITLTSIASAEPPAAAERDAVAFEAKRVEVRPVGASCEATASATAVEQANVHLTFSAPCHGNARVTVHHSGLMFTATTNDDGDLDMQVPALTETAVYIVELASGPGAVASTQVSGLDQIDRVALQWTGNSGFEIHAREFGAQYGQAGHIWSGANANSQTSQVQRLGDANQLAPRMVEVYSFARNTAENSGIVALSIEAEVSAINCGREISAQTLELREDRKLRTRDLELSMPNCNAIGDFLVLNNLVEDLKIASK
ncbi:hypothetical protein FEE96_09300 [Parasedimentitalea maritima]|uniref:Uncharacterized protein n=1 Tax=Parasedimentitalea maritima TaxID=2578117 RepID=A0A5R8ZIT7_9RHOB|nr:hypothetical protein [Zongyanglinia marina]KAE9630910.1 hypothetical protein GP644_06710 [Zongyanglinia marina]TLP65692.1 hypothetical protein FEE96_09300 [Zongyanglinia marina]